MASTIKTKSTTSATVKPQVQMVGHFTTSEYEDIERTIQANQQTPNNHVTMTAMSLLSRTRPNRDSSTLLDIGAGPGLMCQALAPQFQTVTAFDINPEYKPHYQKALESHENFKFIFGDFTKTHFPSKYTHLLSSHMMYYTPQPLWPSFIQKILSILQPNGQALIILEAPQGRFHEDLCYKINPKGAHSGILKVVLKSLGIGFQSKIVDSVYIEPNRAKFKAMVRMFSFDNCYIRADYEGLSEELKAEHEQILDEFVEASYNEDKRVFIVKQESEHIVIRNTHSAEEEDV